MTVLEGPNGAGKSAVLEAIHLVARGKSYRPGGAESLVRHGCHGFGITLFGSNPLGRDLELSARKPTGRRLQLFVDGSAIDRVSTVARLVPLQLVLPGISDLVFGQPASRRQWLDWGAFHAVPSYLECLQRFQRTLNQRNVALRRGDSSELDLWTARMAECGEVLTQARESFLARLSLYFRETCSLLAPELIVHLELEAGFSGEEFADALAYQRPKDIKLGITQRGPHRADVAIRLAQKGRPGARASLASRQLSRGQGKALAAAMKLAQAKMLAEAGDAPIFLLDEALAELDYQYGSRLFAALAESPFRAVLTTTSAREIVKTLASETVLSPVIYHMSDGALARL